MTWPAEPVVAKAYMDQMQRSGDMTAEAAAALTQALDRADSLLQSGARDAEVSNLLKDLTQSIDHKGLTDTVSGVAARLQ